MSGRVVFTPERKHSCAPGWTRIPVKPGGVLDGVTTHTMRPPDGQDIAVGARWQCDDCGQVWVRRKPPVTRGQQLIGGMVVFTREHWWERLRRERKDGNPPPPVKGGPTR